MNKPKMIIIFDEKVANEMNRGQIAAFAAHAAMWLGLTMYSRGDLEYEKMNEFGEFKNIEGPYVARYINWLENKDVAYRKIVLSTNNPIRTEFKKFANAGFPCYLQRNAHKEVTWGEDRSGVDLEGHFVEDVDSWTEYEPVCFAVFGTDEELAPLTKGMELLK